MAGMKAYPRSSSGKAVGISAVGAEMVRGRAATRSRAPVTPRAELSASATVAAAADPALELAGRRAGEARCGLRAPVLALGVGAVATPPACLPQSRLAAGRGQAGRRGRAARVAVRRGGWRAIAARAAVHRVHR